jgi:hypothetical protein
VAQTKKASSGSSSSARRTSGARSGGSKAPRSGSGSSRAAAATQRSASPSASANGADTSSRGLSAVAGAVGDAGKYVVKNAAFPVATAMAGAAAGIALGQRQSKRRKKVLGVPIPGTRSGGVDGLAKNVGEAGKQLARLADEVRTGRKKAEEIGKALS